MTTGTVQSVDRAMSLLAVVADQPAGLVDIADRAGLPVSTTARLLSTLESTNALDRSTQGVYRIGPAIEALVDSQADTSISSLSLHTVAHPHLVELSQALGEAACLSVVAGSDIVTVDQVDAPKPVQAENWTGTRVPLHAGGAGIVALSHWPADEIDQYLSGELAACTEHTVTDPAKIRARIARVRRTRVIWTHGEYVDGLSSASAAVTDNDGRCAGVIYVYGPSYRFPPRGQSREIAARVLEVADRVSDEMSTGGRP